MPFLPPNQQRQSTILLQNTIMYKVLFLFFCYVTLDTPTLTELCHSLVLAVRPRRTPRRASSLLMTK